MLNVKEILLHLSALGVDTSNENDVSRRISFTNIIFLALPIVYLIFMIIDYQSYQVPIESLRFDQFVVPIIILVCFIGLFLNSIKYTAVSRAIFILLWPLLLHIIPIILLDTPPDYYLAFPFGLVFHAMLIQLMVSFRRELFFFVVSMAINLIALILFPAFLILFDADGDLPHALVDDKYYLYDGILYWLLFNLVTFYILYTVDVYIDRTNKAKALIEDQKEELHLLNENLEQMVAMRTLVLQEQNRKLQDYAFYNAHILRGPFCRVKGLIMLQERTTAEQDKDSIKKMLEQSIEELENRIQEIQHIVQTENDSKDPINPTDLIH